ncbi:hypothetical protein CHL76_11995 [Marinococcus halophilus]|uniref:Conjugal transfer protein n=1 Tax=Marinococcus halophilus TaxID=1371 RepID=A0A510Y8E0_MARHA|nr:type IV secretory system conjugative DNA transfer family protein [Marinococcus halophilus]OZT79629.1 hypothetical protein CHL76_11995 [Marinococcus halophilus]GEK59433.1 conjugal transfer protein [Marinococcus halophilus]
MKILKTKKAHGILALLGALVFFLLSNTLINFCITNVRNLLQGLGNPDPPGVSFNFLGLLFTTSDIPALGYLFLFIATLIVGGIFYYKLRSNFKDLTEGDAKGSSRFTTLKEIQQQYKAIPEKATEEEQRFPGEGGVPVSREGKQIYIDDSKSNNLWIGTTRSGKGEIGMFPMIDIYSRAEQKASMVLNDPKGELLAASKATLEHRGYHVEALNLIEPEIRSMSFQILRMVIDAYEEGDLGKAEQHAKAIAHMLYSDPEAKDKFWQDSASSLCTALILGLCEKNLPDHPEKITMYSVANILNELASQQTADEKGNTRTGLDDFFDSLPASHPAKLQYATVKFASGAGQTVAGIYANAFDKLSIFTLTPIAKMTSHHSFDMRKVGFGKHITGIASAQGEVTATFPEGTERTRANTNGLFKFSHDRSLEKGQTVTFHDHKKDTTLTVMVEAINEETGTVTYKVQNEPQEVITLREFEHFTKPTAVFLLTPDDDTSLHVIASLYVKQLYTELAKTSYFTPGRKCIRQVVFILDEFGNMPAISDMGNMITVSLGRRIHFNLVVQDLSQIKHKYDKEADNIIGNCANKMYLLSTDYETNEEFSKLLGEKTISSNSRSGSTLSTDKNKTEGTDGRRLLDASELGRLKPGEMVVYRGIKREDLNRENVTPYPIFNHGKSQMKFRYEYLSDQFNTDTDLEDINITCDHAGLDLTKVIYRFEEETTDHGPANQDGPKQDQPQSPSSNDQQKEGDNNQPADNNAPKQAVGISEDAAAFESKPVQEVIDATLLQILDQQVPLDVHQMNVSECEASLTEWNEAEWIPERMMTQTKDAIKNERRKYQKSIDKGENEHAEPISSTTG